MSDQIIDLQHDQNNISQNDQFVIPSQTSQTNQTNQTIDELITIHIDNIIGDKINCVKLNPDYDIPVYNSNKHKVIKQLNKTILVLSGGGIKGLAMIGALKRLDELGVLKNIQTYAGTSAGGIISVLLCIGYTPKEIYKFLIKLDFKKLLRTNLSDLLDKYGIDSGIRFEIIFKKLIGLKGYNENTTLKELYEKTMKTIYITGTCLNDKNIYYFSHKTDPEMPVVTALRITSCLPIYFTPILYKNKLFVDGGCINNYPANLFANELHNVIGIYPLNHYTISENIVNVEDFFSCVFQCLLQGMTYGAAVYKKCTLFIELENVGVMDLTIDQQCKEELFKKGYDETVRLIG